MLVLMKHLFIQNSPMCSRKNQSAESISHFRSRDENLNRSSEIRGSKIKVSYLTFIFKIHSVNFEYFYVYQSELNFYYNLTHLIVKFLNKYRQVS